MLPPSTSFAPRAQCALELARHEADRLNHRAVGTGHLLVALLRERDGLAAHVLATFGVELPTMRALVEEFLGRGDRRLDRKPGLSPATWRAIELAREEAAAMGQPLIDTEHLLLGILLEGEDVGAAILGRQEVWLRHVHQRIRRLRSS
jgi:ATP-dependent Clp protease ATP-binding subunit ClpC